MLVHLLKRPVRVWSWTGVLCLVAFLFGSVTARAQQPPELSPEDVQKAEALRRDMRQMMALARDQVFPALVNIEVITVQYWGGKEHKGQSVGSGTIISPQGYVLTNFHVAENGRKFKCTLSDKQELSATLVGDDPLTDLAVLKLDLSELKNPDMPLPVARIGNSDELHIGDTVMAMGSPWALSRSVTRGSVSNTERILSGDDDDPGEMQFDPDQRTGIFNRWIQHDAAINPGNSGGPLVNLQGEVIGVNTRGGGNMGFAIPSNIARTVAADLIEHGEVPRSFYGLSLKSIKKTGLSEGVLVNSVIDDGPADKAGIQAGDVILRIDGEPVTALYPEQIPPLLKHLADREIGGTVRMAAMRDEETFEADVVTEKRQRDRGDEAAFRAWGISAKEITERMAHNRRLDSTEGVLVSGVRSGSSAQLAEPPISYDDVIRAIDGEPLRTLSDFIERYEEIMDREQLPEYLLIEFDRTGKSHVTLLKPKPEKDEDPPREVAKAWIGVAAQPVIAKLAEYLGHPEQLGFRVTRVYPRTLAAQSDLRVGDVILKLNGDKLTPLRKEDAGLFQREVRRLSIDDEVTLTVLRDGEQREIALKLERTRLTQEEARRDHNRDFDLTVRELTFFDRDENRWDESVRGVLVFSVEAAGWAGLGGLQTGDLIQRIGDRRIRGIKSYRRAMEAVAEEQPERVVFVVFRGVRTHFQYVEPEWKPTTGDADQKADESPDDEE
ncbi:MAG: PDZ domain-containing protein [Planctomycetes bacterium]|nr:PDZ domain-containing protein [Planctomycetota bacterium]